jgi:23S rRNA (adenine2030-N6)-methyltransferase
MLSYLHSFHAGNHADVLKHLVLLALLDRLTAKGKPLRYVETHSGAGGYDLRSREAQHNREFESGVAKLWEARKPPALVAALLALVRGYNGERKALERYPGSPWLARARLREDDSIYLFELHPAEHRALAQSCAGDRRVTVLRQDGLEGAIGLVPPPERRALVFVDPSYEVKHEHRAVVDALAKAHRRFAIGVYAVWYPVIDRRWVQRFERALRATGIAPIDVYELSVAPDAHGRGLTGSGMVVVNPPWRLREELAAVLPWVAETLAPARPVPPRIAELAAARRA